MSAGDTDIDIEIDIEIDIDIDIDIEMDIDIFTRLCYRRHPRQFQFQFSLLSTNKTICRIMPFWRRVSVGIHDLGLFFLSS